MSPDPIIVAIHSTGLGGLGPLAVEDWNNIHQDITNAVISHNATNEEKFHLRILWYKYNNDRGLIKFDNFYTYYNLLKYLDKTEYMSWLLPYSLREYVCVSCRLPFGFKVNQDAFAKMITKLTHSTHAFKPITQILYEDYSYLKMFVHASDIDHVENSMIMLPFGCRSFIKSHRNKFDW